VGEGKKAHLERDEPHALDGVADEEQILDGPQGGDVDADVQERDADEALVEVERAYEDLRLMSARDRSPLQAQMRIPGEGHTF
jgi:hypothetical protein